MARKEEVDQIFENIISIPIINIIEAFVPNLHLRQVGENYQGESPFRKDSSMTSFTLSSSKNIFKDWVMEGYTGNGIKFVSLYKNLTFFEAAIEIAFKFNIVDEKVYSELLSRRAPKNTEVYEKKYNVIEKVENHIASPETLDKVYRIFISFCKLNESHKDIIINDRNLTEEEIEKYNLFSFPSRGIVRKFSKKIKEEFGNLDILGTIPGFYKRTSEQNYTFVKNTGIGIPITNADGLIIGIQIRKDVIGHSNNRYSWFSSAFAINDPKKENEKGTSSGSPVAVIYPEVLKYKTVFITEGFWKALELSKKFNCIVLSVQGVSTWKPIKGILDKIFVNMNSKYIDFEIKKIYPAFDADMCRNVNVYFQLKKMTDFLEKHSYDIEYICWDMNLGKGIDDMIQSGHINKIKNIRKKDYDEAYEKLINQIIEEKQGEYLDTRSVCTKMSSDEFGLYYDEFFDLESFKRKET